MPWRAAGHFMRAGARRDAFLGYLGSLSLLDSRAGSPATAVEILRRNHAGKNVEELRLLLHDWEVWCADILESHLSYPVLAYYRSQHDQQSWVGALTVVLDTCALILTGIEGIPDEAAKFTFAMARHAVVDLAQVLDTSPTTGVNRLSSTDLAHLLGKLSSPLVPDHQLITGLGSARQSRQVGMAPCAT